jgi:hypothetical protein
MLLMMMSVADEVGAAKTLMMLISVQSNKYVPCLCSKNGNIHHCSWRSMN